MSTSGARGAARDLRGGSSLVRLLANTVNHTDLRVGSQ